jgi:hypothetical protein
MIAAGIVRLPWKESRLVDKLAVEGNANAHEQ